MAFSAPDHLLNSEVPVDWNALEDAFGNNAPEVRSYLHLATGDVLRIVSGVADPEMHEKIAESSAYLRINPVNSGEQYGWMERFIDTVECEELADALLDAVDGKGAFRRFKDALMNWPGERERWFAFRGERVRVFMEAWLAGNGITSVTREVAPPARLEIVEYEPPVTQAALMGNRSRRSRTELLRSLDDALMALGSPRDLEEVLAFAEFVRERSGGSRRR